MAHDNYPAVMAEVRKHEGGYVDHKKDPGGATNMGITFNTLKDWRKRPITKADVKALTWTEAQDIYRAKYWNPIQGDLLPAGPDLAVMDFGVNSGTSRSVKNLQMVVGLTGKQVDGRVGGGTLKAVKACPPVEVVKALCERRMGFLRGLKTWGTFYKGWSRRVASVEAVGVAMALAAAGKSPVQVSADLSMERLGVMEHQSEDRKKAVASGMGGTVTTVAYPDGMPEWVLYVAIALIAIALINYLGRARHNANRAAAYATTREEVTNA